MKFVNKNTKENCISVFKILMNIEPRKKPENFVRPKMVLVKKAVQHGRVDDFERNFFPDKRLLSAGSSKNIMRQKRGQKRRGQAGQTL